MPEDRFCLTHILPYKDMAPDSPVKAHDCWIFVEVYMVDDSQETICVGVGFQNTLCKMHSCIQSFSGLYWTILLLDQKNFKYEHFSSRNKSWTSSFNLINTFYYSFLKCLTRARKVAREQLIQGTHPAFKIQFNSCIS